MEILINVLSSFSLQLLVAELIFCFFLQKRKFFWLKLIPLSILFVILTYDMPFYKLFGIPLRFFITFTLSIGIMLLCFKPTKAVLFCAAAGFLTRVFSQNLYVFCNYFSEIPLTEEKYDVMYYLCYLGVYIASFFVFSLRIKRDPNVAVNSLKMLSILLIVIFVNELLGAWLYRFHMPNNPIVPIYGMLCSLLALLLQFQFFQERKLNEQNAIYEQLLRKEREQYELSKQNIELLNTKCHDIKHMLALLRKGNADQAVSEYCAELENTAYNYDNNPKTGNTALDVTIAEMQSVFLTHNVSFTYTTDGKLLEKIAETDIYSLFGNILRNALNGSITEPDAEKRSIALTIYQKAGQIYIHEDNNAPETVRFVNGIPQTTEDKNFHGFGTHSIVNTVKKYSGNVLFSQKDKRFYVDILIPLD